MRAALLLTSLLLLPIVTSRLFPAAADPAPQPPTAALTPGALYVSSFPLAERREVCLHLAYADGTAEFEGCLEGYFPENPEYDAAAI